VIQFSKLRLAGFKSFVDATELWIEPGMTGIVGPNGCGKSNLVEALRWAMGENSARRMRGGEMDDLIFGGTATRPARNIAEVTILLDNAARGAPAPFNDVAEIEVSRRIERGAGSLYRVNGREMRQRDVQLLFADCATGPHSPGLVSQGRVGAIIAAKPTERRALLEEAAGIAGLHARRHEAELRLRAAEGNLARLDDVIQTLEAQLDTLKRQARQAVRYRRIGDQIRRAEALFLHILWRAQQAAAAAAALRLAETEATVAARTGVVAGASTAEAEAAAILPERRRADGEAAQALHRLAGEQEALAADEARLADRIAAVAERLVQIDADDAREAAIAADAEAAEARLAGEAGELVAAQGDEAAREDEAGRALSRLEEEIHARELRMQSALEAVAALDARRSGLERRARELAERVARVSGQRERARREHAEALAAGVPDATIAEAEARIGAAQGVLDAHGAAFAAAETARAGADGERTEAVAALKTADDAHTRLAAEAAALEAVLGEAAPAAGVPVVDAVAVDPGFEAALGAALGDDLVAPVVEAETAGADAGAEAAGAGTRWTTLDPYPVPPALPAGAEPLSVHVRGPAALARRLAQIGVVADAAAGARLQARLWPGQRLVTRDGDLWRWDGFRMAHGVPVAAAQRLAQRNRLAALGPALAAAAAGAEAARVRATAAAAAFAAAAEAERQRRADVAQAFAALDQAREAHARLARAAAEAASRAAAVAAALEGLETGLAEAEAGAAEVAAEIAALPDPAEGRERVAAERSLLAERRAAEMEGRNALDRMRREAAQRRERLARIAAERGDWQARAAAAAERRHGLAERRAAAAAEQADLAGRPAVLAARRSDLLDRAAAADAARREAADALIAAEAAVEAAARARKEAEAALALAREDRVRAEAGVAQAAQGEAALAERIRERVDAVPEDLPALAEIDAEEALPDRDEVERRLDRLVRERENIGPVNLMAEAEATELEERVAGLAAERADLTQAIQRLRQGIGQLNREGRERMLAAFEQVNGHFQDLFVRLFGGGRAHLALVEADDPLEAGLEIMASPPGKKLQAMSLLSGGEQALTALALLFAVFLTNPAPICVLDEVDAPLDDANVDRFCGLVAEIAGATGTRFLIITHHRLTMARVDRLYGVTMAERGISQLVSVDLGGAERLAEVA